MYVHYDRQMIYLAHPRTASRATRHMLYGLGFQHRGNHHAPLEDHPGTGWTVFSAVRNHYDAWASWWCKSGGGNPLTPAWIESLVEGRRQYWPDPDLMWGLHSGVCDVLLRFETLEADLSDLLGEPINLPKVGGERRDGRAYRDVIPAPAHAYIGTRYAPEIAELGYSW